ncbi:MAG: sugar phosphate nucleotidyltransferase [Deltaproteobacteria bacterium]|nr:sugar phosphate nucleotidyltransferase [Deltaproteobacteria bacterium]
MKAVILAAAPSDKLQPFTETRAKPMIRVAGRTILDYTIAHLKSAGVTEVVVVVNHLRETIEKQIGHGHQYGLSIEYIHQPQPDGIGGALLRCKEAMNGSPFLLIYGDVLVTGNPYPRVMEQFQEMGGAVAAVTLPRRSGEFGNVYLDPDMRITRLVEKPTDPHLANYVLAGVFLLPSEVFSLLEAQGGDMEQVFQELIGKKQLNATLWDGEWLDITRPWHILEANRMLMDQWENASVHHTVRMENNVHLEGPVHIGSHVVIGAGSVIKGPCYIGHGSYIGSSTLIREYTSLGPDSVVGYGTELKNCVLFGRSVLGRLSFIGDSVIGEDVHLGTGVCTVNFQKGVDDLSVKLAEGPMKTGMAKLGAMIGDHVSIGARHVLEPGSRIRARFQAPDLVTIPTEPW